MIEAMKQALEALEDAIKTTAYNDDREYRYHTCCGSMLGNSHMIDCKPCVALTALRAALNDAQVEKREPVAWIHPLDCGRDCSVTSAQISDEQIPLYSAPPKQEPVGYWDGEFSKDGGAVLYEMPQNEVFMVHPNIPLYAHPAQPEQEPVMWVYRYTREDGSTYLSHVQVDERNPVEVPLYLHPAPPKPEWVSLTDDEIMQMYCEPRSDREMLEFAREFEAKLKEKNHG